MNNIQLGQCSKEVYKSITESNNLSFEMGYKKALIDIVDDLNKLKWIGHDEGWDLAIQAIQTDLVKKLEERENATK